jgi:hypothetical protein
MMRKLDEVTSRAFGRPSTVSHNVGVVLIASLFVALVIGFFTGGGLSWFALFAGACFLIALLLAGRYRSKILGWRHAVLVVAPLTAILASALLIGHPVGFTVAATMTIALSWYALRKAEWHGSRELLEWRRNLIAARDYFAFELSKPAPQLEDEWTPYLIAFGLSSAMDLWTKSFGAAGQPARSPSVMSGAATEPHLPIARTQNTPAWTGGGGGNFGGAGATGTWASELTAYASAIASPAQSSSGSSWSSSSGSSSGSISRSSFSSSSSSSRSGGGGGGGW